MRNAPRYRHGAFQNGGAVMRRIKLRITARWFTVELSIEPP